MVCEVEKKYSVGSGVQYLQSYGRFPSSVQLSILGDQKRQQGDNSSCSYCSAIVMSCLHPSLQRLHVVAITFTSDTPGPYYCSRMVFTSPYGKLSSQQTPRSGTHPVQWENHVLCLTGTGGYSHDMFKVW